jgi:3-oxoacyl-[acyl-carrier-protein] synthase II
VNEPIAITGVGLVTCLGLSAEETWQGVLARKRAMGPMPALESPLPPGRTGAQAPDLPTEFCTGRPREVRYLRWAIEQALRDCGLEEKTQTASGSSNPKSKIQNPKSIAVVLGTTLHGIRQGGTYLRTNDPRPMEQFLAAPILQGALRGLPIHGPALTTCSACSSGLGAIALGMTLLRTGQADLVLAGGYDPVSEYVYAGFDSLRLVAETDPRPFATNRDGMKIAEGYAIVALEREGDALARQSNIENRRSKTLTRVLGYGESSDCHHLTQPHPEGEGAARAIRAALSSAGIPERAIGLISAHATSTPNNDAAEFAGISQVFGDRATEIPVVAFKSHIGHALGGAGAAELILSLMALRDQTHPPTANTTPDSLEFPVRLNFGEPRLVDIGATLNLSLGFGGSNAAMICSTGLPPGARTQSTIAPARESKTPGGSPVLRPVLVTGIGFVAPNQIGNDSLSSGPASPSHLDDSQIAHLLNARRVRRMSEYVKATLAATTVAFQDAKIQDIPAWTTSASAILGTCLGSTNFCESYYRPITKDGLSAANPALFAEGVPNAAAAQLSLMFQVKGGCQTIIGSRTAGIDALWLASLRIASGEWDRAIVSAGEELHETATAIYKALGLDIPLSTGAVSFILESESSARARGIEARAIIDPGRAGAVRADTPASIARAAVSLFAHLEGPLITSDNGTWLDRIHSGAARGHPVIKSGCYLADLASAGPPAELAAALLSGHNRQPFSIFAADYAGTASALLVAPGPRLDTP